MSLRKEGIDSPDKAVKVMSHRQKMQRANYELGQRSIDHLKQKLTTKMNRYRNSYDKSIKREEIFKMKLKNLGSANFILRKNHDDSKLLLSNSSILSDD